MDLFDTIPASRNSDPLSSFEAEGEITRSGQRQAHAAIVLRLVEKNPGSTYRELYSAAAPGERDELGSEVELMRRLNDLVRLGRVCRGPQRTCRVTGGG